MFIYRLSHEVKSRKFLYLLIFFNIMILLFHAEIEKLLNDIGKSLKNYPTMPFPEDQFYSLDSNRLIEEETGYNIEEMTKQHEELHSQLNQDQKMVYDAVLENVERKTGGLFFVYGSGGCGKTFL